MARSRHRRLLCLAAAALLAVLLASAGAAHAEPSPPGPSASPPATTNPTAPAPAPGTTNPTAPGPTPTDPSTLGRGPGPCEGMPFPLSGICQATASSLTRINPLTWVFKGLTAVAAETAAWLLKQVGANITATTTPELGLPWFTNRYGATLTIGLLLVAMFTFLAVMQCLLRGAGAEMVRIVVFYLPGAVVLMFLAPTFTMLLLRLWDDFTTLVAQGNGADVKAAVARVADLLGTLASASPPPTSIPVGVGMFMSCLVALGAVVVWLELLLRDAAVYAVELFVPLGLAALVWPAVRSWCRRIIEVLVAVVVGKFFIVAIVNLAITGPVGQTTGDMMAVLGACVALLFLAAFAPVAVLKLIPVAGAELSGALHLRGSLSQAAATVGATEVTGAARQALMSNVRVGAAGAASRGGAASGAMLGAAAARDLAWPGQPAGPPPGPPPSPPPGG